MQTAKRTLIIGLDGATWDVLDPWLSEGILPNLAKLRKNGRWGTLRSSIPPITAAAWSNFMTGKRPGKHGVFHFFNLFDDGNEAADPQTVNARSLKSSTLWDIFGHHNQKVILINIPMTYPPRPVNGLMITGLLTPKHASVFTYPPELSKNLTDYKIDLERFIDTKPFEGPFEEETTTPSLALVAEFRDMMEKRAQTALSLMASNPWDFYMVVFTGTDRMGHYLWPYHHPPPTSDNSEAGQIFTKIREYYIRLDEVVGELVKKAGEDVNLVIMSDHGMGAIYNKRVHWNNWLREQGWLSVKTNQNQMFNISSWLKKLGLSRDKVGRILKPIFGTSNGGLPAGKLIKKAAKASWATIDLNQSKAYCVPMFHYVFGIRLNEQGQNKERLREEIMASLQRVVDPETGRQIVQQVFRGEEYYAGPDAKNIPEIIAVMDPTYTAGYRIGHYSSIVTELQARTTKGDHRMEGIFIASGPSVQAKPDALMNLNIEDVTPTVLHLMNLPVPEDMDGRVLTEIFVPALLEKQPVRKGKKVGFWPDENQATFSDEVVSEEDEQEIRDRLQALGYLE